MASMVVQVGEMILTLALCFSIVTSRPDGHRRRSLFDDDEVCVAALFRLSMAETQDSDDAAATVPLLWGRSFKGEAPFRTIRSVKVGSRQEVTGSSMIGAVGAQRRGSGAHAE